jgi:amidase
MSDLTVESTARDMAEAVRDRQISARELLELHLHRIDERNGDLNAIVALDVDRAHAGAAAADEHLASGAPLGALHGLPFAFKDTHEVAGWRTTYGSTIFANHVPTADELMVERIRRAGVVILGRTNTPEFAAGSHTFNRVYGTTRNPFDRTRSAGGSSGGAAAALAAGMVPLADGSDMGGSLRNPASFCGVVGLRPSLGRVPQWPLSNQWESTSVGGPMARNVSDTALLLSVLAGPDPRAPMALGDPGSTFAPPLTGSLRGLRVAWSLDLGGAFEVDPEVARVVEEAGRLVARSGAKVFGAWPDLSGADETFRTLRAWHFDAKFSSLLAEHPTAFKQTLADNIRAGRDLTGPDIAWAYTTRTTLAERMRLFFEKYDVLMLPVSQVPPFPTDQEYPTSINGVAMESYLDWMRSSFFITVTGCPAISVPAGFTPDGLPVGVQIVAPHGADRRLLEIAAGFEAASAPGPAPCA